MDEKQIEELSRKMCAAEGNDPDLRITRHFPSYARGLISSYRTADDESCFCSAWEPYCAAAKLALEHIKSADD